jgi:glycosyl transferase family 25
MFSTVVINLDRDTERLAFMQAQLEKRGISFERQPGTYGADMPPSLRSYFANNEDGSGFLSHGELGCYASHLDVYERIASGQVTPPTLVLEDDVLLPPNLAALIEKIIAALPSDWDMVRLSSTAKRAYVTFADLDPVHALVRYSVSPGSNGALLVSAAGARKFLNRSEKRRLPIDQDNRRLWRFDLNLYGVVPAPIQGNAFGGSTIDNLASAQSREDNERQRRLSHMRDLNKRHAWNIRQFGLAGWAGSEWASLRATLTPRRLRPKYLERAGRWLGTISKRPRAPL